MTRLLGLLLLAALMAGCGGSQDVAFTETSNTVPPAPAGRLVVANYDDDNILVFDMAKVVDGQVNNIAPGLVISGPQTTKNYDLTAAGANAVWSTNENGGLYLFSDLERSNGTASLTLAPNFRTLSIGYDEGRDILYSDSTRGAPSVAIFDKALGLPNNSDPTRALTGFAGPVETLTVDPVANRLYVIVRVGPTAHQLHVFQDASRIVGDIAGLPHAVTSFELGTPAFGASYDATDDRVWFGEFNEVKAELETFFFIDKVAQLGVSTTVNSVGSGAADKWFWDTLYDARLDRLFVSDANLSQQTAGSICIYNNPGSIPNGNSVREPNTRIAGPATRINDVSGIALLR